MINSDRPSIDIRWILEGFPIFSDNPMCQHHVSSANTRILPPGFKKKNIRLGFLRLGLRRLGLLALLRWFRQFVVHQLVQLAAGETTYLYIFIYMYIYIYICMCIYILHKYVYIYIYIYIHVNATSLPVGHV